MECPKCKAENSDSNLFCDGCGAYIGEHPSEDFAEISDEAKKEPKKREKKPKRGEAKKHSRRGIIIICAALLAVIAVIASVAFALARDREDSSPLVYRKENSLMVITNDAPTPFTVTDTVVEPDKLSQGENQAFRIVKSEDGSKILYSDSITSEGAYEVYKLYLRDVENPASAIASADSVKGLFIASGVCGEVQPSADFKKAAYLRNPAANGSKLVVYNMKEEIPIDTDVIKFFFAENGKKLIYLKKTGSSMSLYECKAKSGAEPKLVDNNINEIIPMDREALNAYAVIRSDSATGQKSLMHVKKGKTPVLINAAVKDVFPSAESSEYLYYSTEEKATLKWSDYIEDDAAASDAAMKKPVRADYPSDEAFNVASKEYEAKENRDSLRATVGNATAERTKVSLNVYHKGAVTRLTPDLGSLAEVAGDIAVYTAHSDEGVKIKISELSKSGAALPVGAAAEKLLAGKTSMYISESGNSKLILEDARLAELVKPEKDMIYVAENCAADMKSGDLSAIYLKDGKKVRIDSVVSLENICFTADGGVYYIKNITNGAGTLCGYRGKKSEELVKNVGAVCPAGNSSIFYFTDYASAAKSATLGVCEKFSERHVDTDVLKDGIAYKNGCVYYIKGDSNGKGGSLYRSCGKRDVSLIGEYVKAIY